MPGEPVILIVEDDFLLRQGSAETIEHAGFEPPIKIIATSGRVMAGKNNLPAGSLFMQRPYRGQVLVRAPRVDRRGQLERSSKDAIFSFARSNQHRFW